MIRLRDAHAWNEVLDSDGNWIRADATPYQVGGEFSPLGQGGEFDENNDFSHLGALAINRSMDALFDSFKILWYRRVVTFDDTDQREIWQLWKSSVQNLRELFSRTWDSLNEWSPTRVATTALAAMMILFGLVMGVRWWLRWNRENSKRNHGFALGRNRKQAAHLLDVLRELLASSPFLDKKLPDVVNLRKTLERLRFGPEREPDEAREALNRARKELGILKRANSRVATSSTNP